MKTIRWPFVAGTVALSLFLSPGAAGAPAAPPSPGRVFALLDPGESAATMRTFAQLKSVDGLAYRAWWRKLEPRDGGYDWQTLDAAVAAASAAGKKVTVHVGGGGMGTPSWLTGLGVQSYTYRIPGGLIGAGTARTDPVPWDAVYGRRFVSFVGALGQHVADLGKRSTVGAVSVGVPVGEMTILGCANGRLEGGPAYDRAAYLAAWRTTIDATVAAFPGTRVLVSLPIGFICRDDRDGTPFVTEVVRDARQRSAAVGFFAADLNAAGSSRAAMVDPTLRAQAGISFQMIWSATNDPNQRMNGTLGAAVCRSWALGGRYVELYKADLVNPAADVQAAVATARTGRDC